MSDVHPSTDERCKRCGYTKSAHKLPGINVCSLFVPSSEAPPSSTDVRNLLLPAEAVALTIGLVQVTEGRELLPNIGALCVLALARITGKFDYTKEPT